MELKTPVSLPRGAASFPLFALLALAILVWPATLFAAERAPNLILILADDLGFSDLGCYGGEIPTPTLDRLATRGIRWSNAYNTARCWPTRASLLSGYYAQQVRRDAFPEDQGSASQSQRPAWATLVPSHLRAAGYKCYQSGKWHVDGTAANAGFDRSFRIEDHDHYFLPKGVFLDDQPVHVTESIVDRMLQFLHEDHQSQDKKPIPFFAYLAFTAPHFPLQAPPSLIAAHRSTYQPGWDQIRLKRSEKVLELFGPSMAAGPWELDIGPPYEFPKQIESLGEGEVIREGPWSQLSPTQKEFQVSKMAIHAAMVQQMDQQIERLVDWLKQHDQFEDTLILFLSDNGASAEIMVRGDGHNPKAPPGSDKSFLCLGPGWSRTCNTPMRRHKTWTHEGGIATPLIAHYPRGMDAALHGTIRHDPVHVIDLFPTLIDAAKIQMQPSETPARPGVSLWPAIRSGANQETQRPLWWMHEGNRAIRIGKWKAVAAKDQPWELYDMESDRGEQNDLASEHPEQLTVLTTRWQELAKSFQEDRQKP
ncbi:MAG: sulfatase-like hydrolase/transferase [Pirellulaceae bacterium]